MPEQNNTSSERPNPRPRHDVYAESTNTVYVYDRVSRMYSAFEQTVGDKINPEELPDDAAPLHGRELPDRGGEARSSHILTQIRQRICRYWQCAGGSDHYRLVSADDLIGDTWGMVTHGPPHTLTGATPADDALYDAIGDELDRRKRRAFQHRDTRHDAIHAALTVIRDVVSAPGARALRALEAQRDDAQRAGLTITEQRDAARSRIVEHQELLHYLWSQVDWRYLTSMLTTEECEMWADAIEEVSNRDHPDGPVEVDRWWRPSTVPDPGIPVVASEAAREECGHPVHICINCGSDSVRHGNISRVPAGQSTLDGKSLPDHIEGDQLDGPESIVRLRCTVHSLGPVTSRWINRGDPHLIRAFLTAHAHDQLVGNEPGTHAMPATSSVSRIP